MEIKINAIAEGKATEIAFCRGDNSKDILIFVGGKEYEVDCRDLIQTASALMPFHLNLEEE